MQHTAEAQTIMRAFVEETGLSGAAAAARRYLWTDAFAVCNFLGLSAELRDPDDLALAERLIAQVHETLGRHRRDGARSGWLSGLPDAEAERHPTLGGLRIGKKLDERKPGDAADAELEWEQDGQYFHYLTRWMHALDRAGAVTGQREYNRWARELAVTAHRAFVYGPPGAGAKRMYWKMSIDLSQPLVSSMGHHDPLDGLITYLQLQACAAHAADDAKAEPGRQALATAVADFSAMCRDRQWATRDELGMGSMLTDAGRLARLIARGQVDDSGLLAALLADIETSLHLFASDNRLQFPADYRLAFRELGLAIGLSAVAILDDCIRSEPHRFVDPAGLSATVARLRTYTPLGSSITACWLQRSHRLERRWLEHADINNVMLATALAPGGYLGG